MEVLAASRLTYASVTKIRALEDVAVWALGSLAAPAIEAKSTTNWVSLTMLSMGVGAVIIPAVAVGKVQAKRHALFGCLVRKIAGIAFLAVVLQEPVAADGNLGGVVCISALRALQTGTYTKESVRKPGVLTTP